MIVLDITDNRYFYYSAENDPGEFEALVLAFDGLAYELITLDPGVGILMPVINNQVSLDRLVASDIEDVAVFDGDKLITEDIFVACFGKALAAAVAACLREVDEC